MRLAKARRLAALCVAASLTACGGVTQPPAAIGQRDARQIGPAASKSFLYLATTFGLVEYYTYPGFAFRGSFTARSPHGLCSNSAGDVFVVDTGAQAIDEYPPDSSTPLERLDETGYYPFGCSVDPASGNLAVAGGDAKAEANVAIYANASGTPVIYKEAGVVGFYYCTYDGSGNLFTEGDNAQRQGVVAEIPKGGTSFTRISLNVPLDGGSIPLQWDGTYLAVAAPKKPHSKAAIYQVQISGSAGTVVNTVLLDDGPKRQRFGPNRQFWIQGDELIEPKPTAREFVLWAYPAGGKPQKTVDTPDFGAWGVTVSVP